MRQPGQRDGQHRAAGAEVERVARVLAAHDLVQHFEAAGGGAVMASAEGKARLDLDGEFAAVTLPAVMRAMDEETAGAYRLQSFQRARHPVDVGQGFALDRLRKRKPGKDVLHPRLDSVDIAVGIERHFVDVAVLVDFEHGDRQAVILESRLERGEDAVSLDLAGDKVEPRLGHCDVFCWSTIFSENRFPLFGTML
jgi:hypothetical protein